MIPENESPALLAQLEGLTPDELKRLAERERWRQDKARRRALRRQELEGQQAAPPGSVYVMPKMPAGLSALRRWLRNCHDAYSRGELTGHGLNEARRSAGALGDLYRAGAEIRKADAAIRASEAQERMAEVLASVEHGGAAVMLLARLQESLADGKRRPLPPLSGR